jgi:hypothetical protein
MGEFEVYQRTKDGYFAATKLLNHWNTSRNDNRRLDHFWNAERLPEFMHELAIGEGLIDEKSSTPDFGVLKNMLSDVTKGKNSSTWMHPYLFVKFAMYLNARFEYQVVKFVGDQLIEFRHGAGDNYRELSSAVMRLDNINYPNMARGLNYIVFGKHDKELRQNATEKQLEELQNLQKNLAFSINTGLINS